MTFKAIATLVLCLLIGILAAGVFVMYYRGNAIYYRTQHDRVTGDLKLTKETIDDMAVRQRAVAALDEKYTKELASAQATIDQLQRDVVSGKRRLQLNATCAKQSAISTGVDDTASPGLTDFAERHYFTLRSQIEFAGKQIAGLQQYIKDVVPEVASLAVAGRFYNCPFVVGYCCFISKRGRSVSLESLSVSDPENCRYKWRLLPGGFSVRKGSLSKR